MIKWKSKTLAKHFFIYSFFKFFNRNSGFTFGKAGKVVLAIRSTHGLEVPLTDDQGKTKYTISLRTALKLHLFIFSGNLLVDKKYVDFVLDLANSKLRFNSEKIRKLEKGCEASLFSCEENSKPSET